MVIPKINLSKETQNNINLLVLSIRRPTRSKNVLEQYVLSSLKRLRTVMQLSFIKECIKEGLITKRVRALVPKVHLNNKQKDKLMLIMMKNIRKDIYNSVSKYV